MGESSIKCYNEKMKLSQKVALNTFAQILGKIFSAGTMLIITMVTIRYFGVEDFGKLTAILTYVAYFYLLADFGFNAIVIREAAKNKERRSLFFSSLFSLRFLISLGLIIFSLFLLLILPSPYSQPTIRIGILLAAMTIFAQAMVTSTNAIFQFNLRYDQSMVALGISSLTTLFLAGFFLWFGYSLLSLVVAITLGSLVLALTALILAKRQLPQLRFVFKLKIFKDLLFLTAPLGLTLIFNLAYFKIDKFLIPVLRSLQELGFYETAYKVFDLSLVFPVFFMNAVYPVMARADQNRNRYQRVFKKALLVLLVASFLGMFIGIPASPLIIKIIAGQDLPLSVSVLRILFLSLPLFFLSALLMWDLILRNQQRSLVFIYGAGLVINLVLNLIFIPQFGVLAAAVNTGITETAVLILLFWRCYAT